LKRRRYSKLSLGLIGVVGFALIWEFVSRANILDSEFFPPISKVLQQLVIELGKPVFWEAVRHTMTSWLIGLLIACVAGTVLGIAIGMSNFLLRLTRSTIEFLRPIPSVALIPLAVLLFGARMPSTLMLIVYACFWQVLIQVLYGVVDVDKVATDTARTYGLGRFARVRYVIWPTTLPYLMTGLRLAATIALVLGITSELVIGAPGLGKSIAMAQSGGATTLAYALAVATGFIGVLINVMMRLAEKRVLPWHSSVRADVEVVA